ncbi:MAG: hypothetical protein K940chlam7_00504 [Chlamydiae bacterium]|nr:hypothetical protein [Chlamydiota bacterium]
MPDPKFNAQALCVNSGVLFPENFDKKGHTLDELFTLFHQIILASIHCHEGHLPEERFPEDLQRVLAAVGRLDRTTFYGSNIQIKGHMLDQEIAYPLITTTYNIPIKYHSVVVLVTYDCQKEEAFLNFKMFGHNQDGRMDNNAKGIFLESLISFFEFSEYPYYDKTTETLQFTWKFSKESLKNLPSFKDIQEIIFKVTAESLKGNFGSVTISFL